MAPNILMGQTQTCDHSASNSDITGATNNSLKKKFMVG